MDNGQWLMGLRSLRLRLGLRGSKRRTVGVAYVLVDQAFRYDDGYISDDATD